MNQSSAGDQLGISVNRKPETKSGVLITGYFDLIHTCAETGIKTDYSGPNGLTNAGLLALSTGLLGSAGTSAGTTCGIWISGVATAFASGAAVTTSTYTQAATPVGNGDFDASGGNTAIGSGSSSFNANVFYANGPANIWGSTTGGTTPVTTTAGAAGSELVIVNENATQRTIHGIFVAGCAGNDGSTVRLLAGRTSGSSNNTQLNNGNGIVMSQNDTLSITYTISLAATT